VLWICAHLLNQWHAPSPVRLSPIDTILGRRLSLNLNPYVQGRYSRAEFKRGSGLPTFAYESKKCKRLSSGRHSSKAQSR